MREEAIAEGRCTNYWKCKAPASRRGGMCDACFHEYRKRDGEWVPVPAAVKTEPVKAVVADTPHPGVDAFPQTLGKAQGQGQALASCWATVSGVVKAAPEAKSPGQEQSPVKAKSPAKAKTPVSSPVKVKTPTPTSSPKKSPIQATKPLDLEEVCEVAHLLAVKTPL